MSSHILKPMFSNPMTSSTSTFPRDKFHNQQEWFYGSCWNSNSFFFTKFPFSRQGSWNQSSKVTRSRSRDQTQESEPGFKPRNVWLQSLAPGFLFPLFIPKEEPITGLSSPSAIQVQGLLISEYLFHKYQFLVERIWLVRLSVPLCTNQLCPGLAKPPATTESGGQLLGNMKDVGVGKSSQ